MLGGKNINRHWLQTLFCLLLFMIGLALTPTARAAQLSERALKLSDSTPSVTAQYELSFVIATAGTLGSIELELCSNDPFVGTPCTAPAGLDMSGANLISQSGVTDFVIHSNSTANKLVLSRPPAAVTAPLGVAYELDNIQNPSVGGTLFGRLRTFASNDASGPATDSGGLAFVISSNVQVTTEVPPYLQFCVGVTISGLDCGQAVGDAISLGELSATAARSATSQMMAATNAPGGYSITLVGTTMTAGNNVIAPMSGTPSAPGNGQFGLNLRQNANPDIGEDPTGPGSAQPATAYDSPDLFRFQSNEVVAGKFGTDAHRLFTVSYVVNISNQQPAGRYTTTISYVCLGSF